MEQEKSTSDIINFLKDHYNCLVVLAGLFVLYNGVSGTMQSWASRSPDIFKIMNMLLFAYYFGAGLFLLRFKNWARISVLVFSALYFVLALGALLWMAGQETSLLEQKPFIGKFDSVFNRKFVFNVICHFAVLVILTRKKVIERFRGPAA